MKACPAEKYIIRLGSVLSGPRAKSQGNNRSPGQTKPSIVSRIPFWLSPGAGLHSQAAVSCRALLQRPEERSPELAPLSNEKQSSKPREAP